MLCSYKFKYSEAGSSPGASEGNALLREMLRACINAFPAGIFPEMSIYLEDLFSLFVYELLLMTDEFFFKGLNLKL